MNRATLLFALLLLLAVITIPRTAISRQPTWYQHLTDVEIDPSRNWSDGWRVFFTPDTMDGSVRSNGTIVIKYRPTFLDRVISSAPGFYYTHGTNPLHPRYEPVFNAAQFPIPEDLPHLRERATETFDSDNGRLMTTIVFNDRQGASVYQRRLGIFDNDSLIATLDPDQPQIVSIDGQLDVKGTVYGSYTLFAEGPIGLLDNLIYSGASERNASFDEARTTATIGLVSRGDIIVRNTLANGRNNGIDEGWENYARHSIMINGALVALNGSFTFQKAGPTSGDYDRGYVYTKGSVVQKIRGGFNSSWDGRIGYAYWYKKYDERLRYQGPPGLDPSEYPIIREDYDQLVLKPWVFQVFRSDMKTLVMVQGGELSLQPDASITIRDTLVLHGEPGRPLEISLADGSGRISLSSRSGYVDLKHVNIGSGISLEFSAQNVRIEACRIEGAVSTEGSLTMINSHLGGLLRVTSGQRVSIARTVLNDGVVISSNTNEISLSQCTIVGSNGDGVRLRGNSRTHIVNSIVAFNGRGIVTEGHAVAEVGYCDVFGNIREDFSGLEAGEGCFSADPLFVDRASGDLHLTADSPCIDAGDPASPLDPDTTRADIGAFWFDRGLEVDDDDNDDDDFPPCLQGGKSRGSISASPNPFNSSTLISFQSAQSAVQFSIYDLSGRIIFHNPNSKIPITWDASAFPAGIYIAHLNDGKSIKSIKLVKVN